MPATRSHDQTPAPNVIFELCHNGLIDLSCLLDTNWVQPSAWLTAAAPSRAATPRTDDVDFDASVRAAADRLPAEQAHALWLVDVCRASYTQGALETGTSPDRFARRVHAARSNIRRTLP